MSTNEHERGPASGPDDDPVMDWALGERLGSDRPPDLVAAVRSRLAAGDVPAATVRRASTTLWAAAVVLLGALVVVGVAAWPRGTAEPAPAGTQGQEPLAPVQVDMLTDIAALPATTRAVEISGCHDVKIAELARLRDLEVLIVREPWNESFGLSLKMERPRDAPFMTAAAWATIGSFTKLRRLELRGTTHAVFRGWLEPPDRWTMGVSGAVQEFALLEQLPLLEHLTLRCQNTPDEILLRLPRLGSLRHLDLSFNHGFAEAGFGAILQCRSLRSLSLEGCQQMHGRWLARLHELPELEQLNLAHIDGINWLAAAVYPAPAQQLQTRAALAEAEGRGPTDGALAGIAKCAKLRVLDVTGGSWTATGLAQLGSIRTLKELRACGGGNKDDSFVSALPGSLERLDVCGDYTDRFCKAVADHLTKLRHLNIAACYRITDRGLAIVAAMPSLRVLDMRQMRGLTMAAIDSLLVARQLEEIDLRHCDFVTVEHVVNLRRALPKLRRLETGFNEREIEAADRQPSPPMQVRDRQEAEKATGVRAIEGIGLDDSCLAALADSTVLESLVLRPGLGEVGPLTPPLTPMTDAGLQHLSRVATLGSLRLEHCRNTTPEGLAVIAKLPRLAELTFTNMALSDDLLARLAALPLQRLTIIACRGFGAAGVEAIVSMRDLRELSLRACVHLDETWIARLAALPQIERLDLGYIGSHTHFSGWSVFGSHVEPGSGVSARAIMALAKATTLRKLSLEYGAVDGEALRSLQALPALESLHLSGTEIAPTDLARLPRTLILLSLSNCSRLDSDIGTVLAQAVPGLLALDLSYCSGFGKDGLASLRNLRLLRFLELSHCSHFGPDSSELTGEQAVALLTALPALEDLHICGWMPLSATETATLRAMPKLRRLDYDIDEAAAGAPFQGHVPRLQDKK
ncbi:MAG: hypothetical protein WAT39_17985 [Planctomycetota bacterium]